MKSNIYETKKLTDRAFSQSLLISIISVMLCVIALSSITWAWFADSVTAGFNTIQSASCEVVVAVKCGDTAVTPTDGKYTFEAGKTYKVDIAVSGTAQSGYCIFVIDGASYYTNQISTDSTMSITMKFTGTENKLVSILTGWGQSSQAGIFEDKKYYENLAETTPPATTSTDAQASTATPQTPTQPAAGQ